MTAKEFVLSIIPLARAVKHAGLGMHSKPYWLIRDGNNYMWFVEGKTESNAWSNAKKKISNN